MTRNALTSMTAAWALVAYLGLLLFAAPCTCSAQSQAATAAHACCCGPDAKTPCSPTPARGKSDGCQGHLGTGCDQDLPETVATDANPLGDELPAPLPAAVLTFALSSPEAVVVATTRARTPSSLSVRLDQVRSTVLLV